MVSVDDAKSQYEANTDQESYEEGLAQFVENSDEDNLEDAWVAAVNAGDSYTGGVSDFLESEGGLDSADVSKDYNWESETLSASGDFATNAEAAGEDYENMSEGSADKWFRRYAKAYGDNE